MGILDDMAIADGGADPAADPAEGATAQPGGEGAEPSERTERVAVPSRRKAAAEGKAAIERQVADLAKTLSERDESFRTELRTQLAQRDQDIARMRGSFEALAQRQAAPTPAAPDPAALRKAARAALDSGDFDEYQNLTEQAILARVPAPQQAAAPAPGIPIPVQAVLASFPDVLEQPTGMQLAIIEDQRLALKGIPNTPARYRQAFELARAQLGKPAAPAFSQSSRGVLAGVPPARNSAGAASGEPGVQLTDYELSVAQRCGMTKAEYAAFIAEANPKRLQVG